MPVFGQDLDNSEVVGTDGTEIGFYQDIEYDSRTGDIEYLLVEPGQNTPTGRVKFDRTDRGRFRVPVENVRAAKDRVLVEH